MELKVGHIFTHIQWITFLCQVLLLCALVIGDVNVKLLSRNDKETFSLYNVRSFGQIIFDSERFQLIVGARDYLFRLTLGSLTKLEENHWPAKKGDITICQIKGKSKEDCRNYIKVLVKHGPKLFSCGTNAFKPECSWRMITSLKTVIESVDGEAKCPHSPYANSSALITSQGDYYIASPIGFSGSDIFITKRMGRLPFLRTPNYNLKVLYGANFVASFEIDNFTYYFFREAAFEYIHCGKVVYSRVARICKNDQGGQVGFKNYFTTFLKARLNCSVPGNYPFYFNEIQSVHYIEREKIFYATFTTPENSIYGTAVCVYDMASIYRTFTGDFKYQESHSGSWERHRQSHKYFQCEDTNSTGHVYDSLKYQLMNEAVQPMTSNPLLRLELERFSHIAVDTVDVKGPDDVHVMFVATVEGLISKYVVLSETNETCLIEKMRIFPEKSKDKIKVFKFLRDTKSLYIGTEEVVTRIPVTRCKRFRTKSECLNAMDPYCGWNENKTLCTTAPGRNPEKSYWHQKKADCTKRDMEGNLVEDSLTNSCNLKLIPLYLLLHLFFIQLATLY